MSRPQKPKISSDAAECRRTYMQLAIGIDNLATLQELFGDALGRGILEETETRLHRVIPARAKLSVTDHLKFLIVLEGLDWPELDVLMDDLQRAASADPVQTRFGPVAVTISIGCSAVGPESGTCDPAAIALHALHTAMTRGIGAIEIANGDLALLLDRSTLMTATRATTDALEANDIVVVHQPVVRAEGGHTIGFHECLVRVRRPDGSLMRAGEFMPAMERLGMAPMIDRRVLQLTFDTLRQHPSARLSVKIFPHTMQDRSWIGIFDEAVSREPELAERLIVEVTETAAMLDVGRTGRFMDLLRTYGVSFALDDFGAGNTSLRQLRDLRFDILKIDGQFIRNIDQSPDDAFLVQTLISIARRYEMMTVAEAVQTPAEARCLASLGVEFFQGFCFGSPSLRLNPTEQPMPMVAAQA